MSAAGCWCFIEMAHHPKSDHTLLYGSCLGALQRRQKATDDLCNAGVELRIRTALDARRRDHVGLGNKAFRPDISYLNFLRNCMKNNLPRVPLRRATEAPLNVSFQATARVARRVRTWAQSTEINTASLGLRFSDQIQYSKFWWDAPTNRHYTCSEPARHK